jgi:hypothetical protein
VSVQVLVLNRSDWDRVASVPIYGMPHTFHDVETGPTVVTGSEPAPFWDEVIAFMWPDVTPPTRERVLAVYGDPPVTGVGYSDLVVVHGLAHLFHGFDPDRGLGEFPRLWLSELFADLGMHGYLAEVEPEQVPVLQTVCLAAREVPPSRLPRSLDDMASALTIDPRFYCVFEHLLTFEAARVWDATGVEGLRRFHTELRRPEMTDDEILDALGRIHAPTAAVIREWAAGRRGSTAVPG